MMNNASRFLGTVLFSVNGGTETPVKKVYMIDARTGDILTSFNSNPVNLSSIPTRRSSLLE
jgi:hypothetical protein